MSAGTSISMVSSSQERTLPKLPLAMCGTLAARSLAASPGVNLADRRHRYGTMGGWCARAGRHHGSTGESHRQLGPIGQSPQLRKRPM
jgi:hypothetical protein